MMLVFGLEGTDAGVRAGLFADCASTLAGSNPTRHTPMPKTIAKTAPMVTGFKRRKCLSLNVILGGC